MISLSGCVAELGVGGVERSASTRMLKIGKNVAGEPIYNLVKTNCVFIERFMRYVCFCGDSFFWFTHT